MTNRVPAVYGAEPPAAKRRCLLTSLLSLAAVPVLCAAAAATEFYVTVNGRPSADGSLSNPWDLATALAHPAAVQPGDTIWLRGGTYRGAFTSTLTGTASTPIKVRQYPGERATLDGGSFGGADVLFTGGAYTHYMDFEITNSDTNRVSAFPGSDPPDLRRGNGIRPDNIAALPHGLKYINLVIHDTGGGVGSFGEAAGLEISGCLIYYVGWQGPDRGHGHGIYSQNQIGTHKIKDNIIFSAFSHGIHNYGPTPLDNIHIEGNVSFNNGAPVGRFERNLLLSGDLTAQNPRIINNAMYHPVSTFTSDSQSMSIENVNNAIVTGNYLAGGDTMSFSANNTVMTDNFFYTVVPAELQAQYPSNTYQYPVRPAGVTVFVRPNAYAQGRANVTIYNWDLRETVEVNIGTILPIGATYEVRNAQDYFGPPVATGVYSGAPIRLPMTGLSVATPVGAPSPPPTGPEFNVFILTSTPIPAPPAAPGLPSGPSPTDGATGVAPPVTLTWNASSGATSYDVYFGTSSNPPLLTTTSATSHPVTVTTGQLYYWKILASNSAGSTSGPLWSFATATPPPSPTPPGPPSNPSPVNGATGVAPPVTLTWNAASGATSYDVYFGTSPNPPLLITTSATSRPVTVTTGQLYYWKILATNSAGSTSGPLWSFATAAPPPSPTPPGPPSNPSPVNGATGVAPPVTLTWNAASGATSYDVYFGTSPNPPLLTTTGTPSQTVHATAGRLYYWKILATNSAGSTSGPLWSFTARGGRKT